MTAPVHNHHPHSVPPFPAVIQKATENQERVEVIVIDPAKWEAHCVRVETLCNLLESMMKAMADTPFAAMLPPDLIRQLRG